MNLFEDLKYRVDLISEEDFPKEVNSILKIPGIKAIYSKPKYQKRWKHGVIKYIGLMYDPKSPFATEYRDLDRRKMAVATECNFTKSAERGLKFRDEYQHFMDLDTPAAKEAILGFLKDIHYSVWTEIQTTEQELWELTQLRWEKITTKTTKTSKKKGEEGQTSYTDVSDKDIFEATNKKEKLLDAAQKRRSHLKELYEEMFADNHDAKKIAREIPISPENAMNFV